MEIRRIFKDINQPKDYSKPNAGLEVDYVEVIHAPDIQKFTQRFLEKGVSEGFVSIDNNQIIIKSNPENVVYNIIRTPGYYCCHDDQKLSDGRLAKKYIDDNYPGIESPDPQNPSGYRKDNFYFCEKAKGE